MEGSDPDGDRKGQYYPDGDWKGWKGRQLEEIDPDVVAGRGLEGTAIGRDVGSNVVAGRGLEGRAFGRDVGSGRCCWKGIGRDRDWKGWKGR